MDQLIVVLIVGALALVKWLVENGGKFQSGGDAGEDAPPAPRRPLGTPAEPSTHAETDEEKMRRFMEALGLPANGVPPPAQRPVPRPSESQSVAPPVPRPIVRRVERPAFRPVTSAPAEPQPEPAHRSIAPPLETGGPLPKIPKSRPMSESAPAVQVTSFAPAAIARTQASIAAAGAGVTPAKRQDAQPFGQPAPAVDLQMGLREQLGSPAALRRAILLKEILGEPKGLQSLGSPSIFSPL
ncbi:MAG: hypothetical protein WCH57_00220 [Verrucomicrobiota bacterium]